MQFHAFQKITESASEYFHLLNAKEQAILFGVNGNGGKTAVASPASASSSDNHNRSASSTSVAPLHPSLPAGPVKWVATEKVHGANFSVYYCPSTKTVKFAKRTGFLVTEDDVARQYAEDEEGASGSSAAAPPLEADYFYGWEVLKDSLTRQAAAVADYLAAPLSAASNVGDSSTNNDDPLRSPAITTGSHSASGDSDKNNHHRGGAPPPPPPYIILYGELCGGFYPNPTSAAQQWKGAKAAGRVNAKNECVVPVADRAVQEGIYYHNELCFVLFDIAVVTPTPMTTESTSSSHSTLLSVSSPPPYRHIIKFLDFDTVVAAAKSVSSAAPSSLSASPIPPLHTPKALARGTYQHVCDYPYKNFDSTIPELLHSTSKTQSNTKSSAAFTPLPKGTNIAEGIVVKPDVTIMFASAAAAASSPKVKGADAGTDSSSHYSLPITTIPMIRCLVKLKSPSFAEISGAYDEPSPTPMMRLKCLLNANRIASVLSKHGGRVTSKTIDDVAQFMADDIVEDFYVRFADVAAKGAYGPEWDASLEKLLMLCKDALMSSMV